MQHLRKSILASAAILMAATLVTCQKSTANLETQIQELRALAEAQQAQITELSAKIDQLESRLAAADQQKQIADLTRKVAQLESQLAAATKPAAAPPRNLVRNGDFETPFVRGAFDMIQPGQDMDGWTVALNWVDLMTPAAAAPASGHQSVDLSGGSAGQIYQDLDTAPGQTYELRFAMAGTGVVEQQEPRIKQMQIHWGDTLVDSPTFDISEHTIKEMGWTYHTYKVTAVTEKTRLKFTSLSNSAWGPAIDNVSVTAQANASTPDTPPRPEPSK